MRHLPEFHSLRSASRLRFRLPLQASVWLSLQVLATREAIGSLFVSLHIP